MDALLPAPAASPGRAEIALLERLAADALPTLEATRRDGWRLRADGGLTRRGCSVLAEAAGARPLADKLAEAEAYYRQRGLPPRLQWSPASRPAGLRAALAARGYREEPGALVATAELAALRRAAGPPPGGAAVRWAEAADAGWLELLAEAEGSSAARAGLRAALAARDGPRSAYATLALGGEPVAVARGVRAGGWLGVFDVATRPEARRRGAARALMRALAAWGAARGARRAYLQVGEANEVAQRLYAELAFRRAYRYRYLVLDGGGPGRRASVGRP